MSEESVLPIEDILDTLLTIGRVSKSYHNENTN